MFQPADPPLAPFYQHYQSIHSWLFLVAHGDFEAQSPLFFFFFFFFDGCSGSRRSVVMRLSCAATAGTIIFPLTVPSVFLAGVLDRVGPRRLNYPAVLVTPPPVFTRSRRSRGTRANGPLFLDPNSSIFHLYHSFGSGFHREDWKISLHKRGSADFILFLDQISSVPPPRFAAGPRNDIHLEIPPPRSPV